MPGVAKSASFIIKLFGLLRVQWFVKFGVNLTAQILLPDDRVIIGSYYTASFKMASSITWAGHCSSIARKSSRHKTLKQCCVRFLGRYVLAGKS